MPHVFGSAALWLLVLLAAGWAVMRAFGLERGRLLVQLVSYTPYATLAALVPLALAVWAGQPAAAALAGLAAVTLVGCVLPRTLPRRPRATSGVPLRVLTANLLHGKADVRTLVALVREEHVDLLAVQELTVEAQKALSDGGLDDVLPHRVTNPGESGWGSGLYGRFPLVEQDMRLNPGDFGQSRAALLPLGGAEVLVESVHPAPPTGGWLPDWWNGLAGQPAATPDGPVRLLLGDFNATLDHVPLRRLLATGYRDAAAELGKGLRPSWAFRGRFRLLPRITLDHVFVDPRMSVRTVRAPKLPGTDHRPVYAELLLPTSEATSRHAPIRT